MLAERGVEVDHVTVYRWAQRFTPLLADAARFARRSPGDRWFVDETYVKVNGVWRYVYRAVDQYAEVDDRTLVDVTGRSHKYGTARMPLPGIASVVGAAATAVVAFIAGNVAAGVFASIGLACLGVWLVLFNRISLPINKILIAAVDAGETPANASTLQAKWDSIINLRAILQGVALLAFCLTLAAGAQ